VSSELDRVIEAAVADESIFTPANRSKAPPAVIHAQGDIVLEATLRVLLPQGAEAMDALTHRLGLPLDILLGDAVLESSRLHLDQSGPALSYAEIVVRSKILAIGESP
jgi:hypothetical protein